MKSFHNYGKEKVKVLVAQLSLTPCSPMACSRPSSSVHGDSPGRNTGVGCHSFLQGIFSSQETEPRSLALQVDSLRSESAGKPTFLNFFFFSLECVTKPAGLAERAIQGLHGVPLNGCRWWTPLQVSIAWLLAPLRGLAWPHGHLPLLWPQSIQSSSPHLPLQSSPVCGAFD